jgi:NAD(P)-dependent dehydrogenase (short-subunit alcohol dehydrogenase family)
MPCRERNPAPPGHTRAGAAPCRHEGNRGQGWRTLGRPGTAARAGDSRRGAGPNPAARIRADRPLPHPGPAPRHPSIRYAGRITAVTPSWEAARDRGEPGIGAATARLLAHGGWAAAVNYLRDEAGAASVVQDIAARGGAAAAVQADVTDTAAVRTMVKQVERELGPVDVLVCNAPGVSDPAFGALPDVTSEAVETIVLAQLRAVLTPARAVLPAMMARRRGSLVVVSSQLARAPKPGTSALAMANGAVEAAARAMAVELGPHGVRVNTVAPGPTLTDATAWASPGVRRGWADRTPLRRNALAGDVAETIAFLASDAARFVTGGHLAADGGVVMP